MGDSSILEKLEKIGEAADVVATTTKLIDIWEIKHLVERNVTPSVYGQTPRFENGVVLVFDAVVDVHWLIVVDVA
jgi:hypothetical protein